MKTLKLTPKASDNTPEISERITTLKMFRIIGLTIIPVNF